LEIERLSGRKARREAGKPVDGSFDVNALSDRTRFVIGNGLRLDDDTDVTRLYQAAQSIEHSLDERGTGDHEIVADAVVEDGEILAPPIFGPEVTQPTQLQGVSLIVIDTFRAA